MTAERAPHVRGKELSGIHVGQRIEVNGRLYDPMFGDAPHRQDHTGVIRKVEHAGAHTFVSFTTPPGCYVSIDWEDEA